MTSNALTTTTGTPLPAPIGGMTEPQILERLQSVADALAPDAKLSPTELQLFAMVAARNGLDPFAKQIYAIRRKGKVTFQTGIDGYRSGAARTGEYDGSDEPEYGPIVEKPWPHPEWARVTVYRLTPTGRRAQSATAYWDEFYPGADQFDAMWKKMPRNQLAKCAEALALRKAFPYVLADVYVDAEMDQATADEQRAAEARRIAALPTAGDRLAARRASIEAQSEGSTAAPPAPSAEPAQGGTAQPAAVEPTSPDIEEGVVRADPAAHCGWRLDQGRGKPTLACGQAPGHEGDHDWTPVALGSGGRVIRPDQTR